VQYQGRPGGFKPTRKGCMLGHIEVRISAPCCVCTSLWLLDHHTCASCLPVCLHVRRSKIAGQMSIRHFQEPCHGSSMPSRKRLLGPQYAWHIHTICWMQEHAYCMPGTLTLMSHARTLYVCIQEHAGASTGESHQHKRSPEQDRGT
jgi:hypothetical protein